MSLLSVRDLEVRYASGEHQVRAVDGLSFDLDAGQRLAIVGESGSGKSQTVLAIMGLLTRKASVRGSVRFDGEEILGLSRARLDRIRGARIGVVFQDPMSSLNPYLHIGTQLAEVLIRHRGATRAAARAESARMLDAVRIGDARRRLGLFPHELSGGMRQRVTIAMALIAGPALLIADEPTTALDVTVQAEILELLAELGAEMKLALLLITHDLAVVAESCQRCLVMYAGRAVEQGNTTELLLGPTHPYTQGLLLSRPRLDQPRPERLTAIPGQPPNPAALPKGCAFAPRCGNRQAPCTDLRPELKSGKEARQQACHFPLD